MLRELQTWAKCKNVIRRPRRGASNINDTQWVVKFEKEHTVDDFTPVTRAANQASPVGRHTHAIRARLIVRGFKDSRR
eukprot:3299988-Lingulodinium_polyedra.AAC.1